MHRLVPPDDRATRRRCPCRDVSRRIAESPPLETASLIRIAAWFLAGAAAVGSVMAVLRFAKDRAPSSALSSLHGILAAAGLAVLIYAWTTTGLPKLASIALVLLAAAAIGGVVTRNAWRWRQAPPLELLVFGHMMLAAMGYVTLLAAVMGSKP